MHAAIGRKTTDCSLMHIEICVPFFCCHLLGALSVNIDFDGGLGL